MIVQLLLSYLLQILFTIGIIVLFGFIIAKLNSLFYSNMGPFGKTACYVTGFIGTPVHECAHALFCIIFGHKITAIKLFQISSDDGTLGYVSHTYNKKNIYHRIGSFFIGIAPILVISAILYLLAYLLVPSMTSKMLIESQKISDSGDVLSVLTSVWNSIKVYFSHFGDYKWWIFLIISIFLVLHMTLSKADIKNSLSGLGFLLAIIFIVDLIVGLISMKALSSMTSGFIYVGGILICFFIMSIIVSICAVIFSFLLRFIIRR
ncbi:MAG: hypothetical protein E7362_00135 [Clostridiales bacterium]|nr:hypothetical protein [Clostridiales bacterium]